jgi:hypothetical protein
MNDYLIIENNIIINIIKWSGSGFLPLPPIWTLEKVTDPQTQVKGNYIFDGIGYNPADIFQFEIDTTLTSSFIENDKTSNTTLDPENLVIAENQFKIPTLETGTYSNIVIDWGDGTIDTGINKWNDPKLVHTYKTAGVYTIKIFLGVFNGFSFNLSNDTLKLINIEQFGAVQLGSTGDSFQGCSNLISINNGYLDTIKTTNFTNMFSDCLSLKVFNNIGEWDIKELSNADKMFKNVDLSVESYNALLTGWGSQNPQNNIIFDAGLSKYSSIDAELKRTNLINNYNWTITDGGKII